MNTWQAGRFNLRWSTGQPLVMGIVNVTPDSFSDGGDHAHAAQAIAHAERLLAEGADILDLGAESTRPGAEGVNAKEEWARLQPVLQELVRWNVPLSVDTLKPAVMRLALEVGVDILNDVNGFRSPAADGAPSALDLLAASPTVGAVVMHMQGEPRSMQNNPNYVDVCAEVLEFLQERLAVLAAAGVVAQRVLVDPGFGFGKTLAHNLSLMRDIPRQATLGAGVLVGVSRKRMIGELTGRQNPKERLGGSVAAALYAASAGAAVVRVHDVMATHDALTVQSALIAGHQG
ncbi:MAG TPA: dihydropteroate synthase [Limnobacter sp.]|nr:dihydropteroate synthase [Limnobacter sp.]